MAMTKEEQLIRIKDEFRAAHDNASASLRTMLEWAMDTGRYELDRAKAMARAVDEFARALAGETAPDSHGNPVRVNLAYLVPDQGWLWDTRDTISRAHQELNTQHTWRMCYSDVKAAVLTVNDYNERHPDEAPLQFSLDFSGALADDGIIAPTSTELEQLIVPLRPVLADSYEPPEPSLPSFPRVRPRRRPEGSYLSDAPPPADHP